MLLHKSVFNYKAKGLSDELLRMRINEIASVRARYGFWRIHILLKREGFIDKNKRMYKVYFEEGLNLRSKQPKRIKVDNGIEFISKILDRWAYENEVELDLSRPVKPTDYPFIESFNGSLRDECLNANWLFFFEDAQEKFDIWRKDYNGFRPHSSLGVHRPTSISK